MENAGFVYMVLNNDRSAAKIGFTVSPYARLAQLQSASPSPLTMEFAIPAHKQVEADLHRRFSASRIRLEWFSDVQAISEAFCELEQEHADRQLAKEFYGSQKPLALCSDDVRALLG